VEGLDAAVEHFREAGEFADVFDGRPASRRVRAVPPVETSSTPKVASVWAKGHEAGFVGDAEEGAANLLESLRVAAKLVAALTGDLCRCCSAPFSGEVLAGTLQGTSTMDARG
jgi:hypothetical protein